jgi:hypothetical protein
MEDMKMTRVDMGKQDLEGNTLYKYHFTSDKKDFYLVPDNEFYPLFYRIMNKRKEHVGFRLFNVANTHYSTGGYIVLNDSHIAYVNIVLGGDGGSTDVEKKGRIYIKSDNFNELAQKLDDKIADYSFTQAKGKGIPYDDYLSFIRGEGIVYKYSASQTSYQNSQYPGIPKLYEFFKKYKENMLQEAASKSILEHLTNFEDGEYRMVNLRETNHPRDYIRGIQYGKIKLKFNKTDDKLTSITVQNCFTDGEFYDKEKFFVDFKLTQNGQSDGLRFVPFDGRILLVNKYNTVEAVFTKNFQDAQAFQIPQRAFWSLAETDRYYYCKTELEVSYADNLDNDPYLFANFFKEYLSALKE